MKIHVFLHTPFETPGYIEKWIKVKNHSITFTKFYETYTLPKTDEIDWLIVMGGPMGVYEEDKYPWLIEEKSFIKQAVENRKIILGICLGSQLIAEALGAKVFPNKYKEIGWFKIRTTDDGKANPIFNFFPKESVAFHWHGDTFNLPAGAVRLAESEATKNQAFIYNGHVIGLQFHIEVTEKLLNEMIAAGNDELVPGSFLQTADEIRNGMSFSKSTNLLLHNLLDNIEGIFNTK
ncbi:MAG: type 1 glutamine amidotransferase [Ignavibacteriaceae bacterium]|nr:type 1 glutamine amidotransferase [Ignavibacteriaceae bacterium]